MSLTAFASTPDKALPVVDLAASDQSVSKAMRSACEASGFFYLVNHGVAPAALAATFKANQDFHALALDEKLKVQLNQHFRGYQPIGGSTLKFSTVAPAKHPNQSESYFLRHEANSSTDGQCAIDGPNQWPSNPAGFRAALSEYVEQLRALGLRLAALAGPALEEDADEFVARYFTRPSTALRLLHYPPSRGAPADAFGISPHTDYGFLTILAQDDSGGLEIRTPDGDWLPVPPLPDCFVVNIGNALSLMTNGRFVSTAHRVFNPSAQQSRYSIPFFFDPCLDANVEVLPAFDDGASNLRAMNFGEYFSSRLTINFDYR